MVVVALLLLHRCNIFLVGVLSGWAWDFVSFLSIFSSNHSGTLFSSVWAISMALFVLLATILAMSGGENRTVKVNECDMDPQKKPWREGDYGPCYKDTGPNHKRLNCCCQKWNLKAEWNCEEKWHRHPKRVKCDLGNFSFQRQGCLTTMVSWQRNVSVQGIQLHMREEIRSAAKGAKGLVQLVRGTV